MTNAFLGKPPQVVIEWVENQKKTFVKYTDESEIEDFFGVVRSVVEIPYLADAEIVRIGTSITSIGEWAFLDRINLTSITIPNSVTDIDRGAFSGCTSLTSVRIPDSVTSIGAGSFESCIGLTNVTISNGVKSIETNAFWGCINLTSITIPNSVTSIGDSAFWDCNGLTEVTIPDSVTSIGQNVFYNCTALASITIPDGVFEIGYNVFYDISPEPTFTEQSCEIIWGWFGDGVFGYPSDYRESFRYTIRCIDGTVVATPHYKEEIDEWEWNIEITYNVE